MVETTEGPIRLIVEVLARRFQVAGTTGKATADWPLHIGGFMRRFAACIASCLSLAMLASAALAPQASAELSQCDSQFVCLWDGPSFGGEFKQAHDNGLQNLAAAPFNFNDRATSAWNNTARWAVLFQNSDGSGIFRCIPPGQTAVFNGAFNNEASAIQIRADGVRPAIC